MIQVSARDANSGQIGALVTEVSMPVPCAYRPYEQSREAICIVDDDEAVADSLKSLLETFGFDVRSYPSGTDFLADERRHAAGCLIIDQHMPGLNGLDVIDHMQKQGARVPTILISGRLDTNASERATSLGVTNILEKPFAADRLVDLIWTALRERN